MNKKGFGMVEMLISMVVLALVSWFVVKNYFGSNATSQIDSKTKTELSKEGVKTDTMQDMVQSAQSAADKANEKIKEQEKTSEKMPE